MFGERDFKRLFPVLRTDNGPEFTAPTDIETYNGGAIRTRVFYCDPYQSNQKAACENNHRLIRMILPKGASMNHLTQGDVNLMMSHINSYARKVLGGQTPAEVFLRQHSKIKGLLEKLGLRTITTKDITKSKSLRPRTSHAMCGIIKWCYVYAIPLFMIYATISVAFDGAAADRTLYFKEVKIMAITGVMRAALMQLRVLDLETSVDFYTKVVGLFEVDRTSDDRVLLKGYNEFDHHSLVLRGAESAGMDFIGFKVASDAYLDYLTEKTKEYGLPVEEISANTDQPGIGRRVSVSLPTGHRIDFFASSDESEPKPGTLNPEIWSIDPRGIGAATFDHALLFGPGAAGTVWYLMKICGFAEVGNGLMADGNRLVTMLSCGNRMYDIAILEYEQPGKLHSVAYRLNSWSDIGHAADILTMNEVTIDAGPMRQGITGGQAVYFFDPSGNRFEICTGGYSFYPDMPVRVWDSERIGKGIFYYTKKFNDTFFNVVS
jgi:catechol 2,3-dioxygenase